MADALFSFRVQGSEPEPYQVGFHRTRAGAIRITCTCRAGENGLICKHRLALLAGDIAALTSPNYHKVTQAAQLIVGTEIEARLAANPRGRS